MPFNEVSIVSQRREFVSLALQEGANVSLLCARFGISRTTGYKWLERARAGGQQPWAQDLSRRPRSSPWRCEAAMERAVIQVRREHPAWGARKIRRYFEDLFLIENVRNWMAQNGPHLSLPSFAHKSEDGKRQERVLGSAGVLDEPTAEQAHAIETALHEPLSYIWGPPGTGKTRLVLSHAVLKLALGGSRVGVFAPTNIALEQAMEATLEGAKKLEMPKDLFLRLGAPSRGFAKAHPEVCEIQGLKKRIEEAERQVNVLQEVIDHRRGQKALDSGEYMLVLLERLSELLAERETVLKLLFALRIKSQSLDAELAKFSSKAMQFLIGRPVPASIQLEQLAEEKRANELLLEQIGQKMGALVEDFLRIKIDSPRLKATQSQFKLFAFENATAGVRAITTETREWLSVREASVAPYLDKTDEDILALKTDWENELAH